MNIKSLLILVGILGATLVSADMPVITQTELVDLELVQRNTGDAGGVLPVIDRTVTQFGQEAFTTLLSNPITDIQTLQTRQQLIKNLQNPALSSIIKEQLLVIKKHEAALRRSFDQSYREKFAAALKKSYYQLSLLEGLNESEAALDLNHYFEIFALFFPVIEHALMHGLFNNDPCGHSHGFINDMIDSVMDSFGSYKSQVTNAFLFGHGAMTLLSVKEAAEHLYYKAITINVIHQELISISACLRACAIIGEALKDEPLAASKINAELLTILSSNYAELIQDSLDSYFEDSEDNLLHLYSRVGPTLATYERLGKQAGLVNQIMQSAGAIDAMLGAGALLTEQPEQYSFAQYQEGIDPYVKLDGFIHPQLTGTDAIQNSFILSKDTNTDKLVVTGPNTSGKSSITKAIVVNLVLAQTYGIVAAEHAMITPMHRIITYINIRDNLAGGASAFAAERIRTSNILTELSALNGKAPSIALFDDSLFRTTQPIEGELEAYRFIRKITALESNIALVVTHFELLTKLEAESKGAVRNYHIDLYKDTRGKFISTYHLKAGISPRDAIFSIIGNNDYQSDLAAAA